MIRQIQLIVINTNDLSKLRSNYRKFVGEIAAMIGSFSKE